MLQKPLCLILLLTLFEVGETIAESKDLPNYGRVPNFSLVESSGKVVRRSDLLDKVWIVDFIFTRCQGQCPFMNEKMRELKSALPQDPDLMWVSISVDPSWDRLEILEQYVKIHDIKSPSWIFLTGEKKEVDHLVRDGFHLGVQEGGTTTEPIIHSNRFILVDHLGRIRGSYPAIDEKALQELKQDAQVLLEDKSFIPLASFPSINAVLNGTSAILLVIGLILIRRKRIKLHVAFTVAAFILSILFLISYLYYHYYHGSTAFSGIGGIRRIYFTILISHTVLAVAVPFLAVVTLYRAWKEHFEKHVKIARITFPIWLYVSVTGVVVYWMLYQ